MSADAAERRVVSSIGPTNKRAARSFEHLLEARIGRALDIRLNPSSQLAGFAK